MNFYIVLQNESFDEQYKSSYLQCPQKDSLGNIPHYYSRMINLKAGDYIFHYANGSILAIGRVKSSTYVTQDESQKNHVFRTLVDYDILSCPLHIRSHWEEISNLIPIEYSPFQKGGRDNNGYLYPCDDYLATLLLRKIGIKNERENLNEALIVTETKVEAQARIGQSVYKKHLSELWDHQCAICKVNIPEILKASHAKPWKDCTDREKLDPYNGLLLCAHHDSLFDSGLISFDPSGHMLVSDTVSNANPPILNVSDSIQIELLKENLKYLLWHQSYVYKGNITS